MHSFKNDVLRTLALYNAGSFQDIIEIPLWRAVSLVCELEDVHLCPLHFDTGEGHPCTFDIDRPLHCIKQGQVLTSHFTSPK